MGDRIGRPEKRRRLQVHAASQVSVKRESDSESLGCYDVTSPIAIVVSSLRRRQGAILARNLRTEGAHVIEDMETLEQNIARYENASILVVTDNRFTAEQSIAKVTPNIRSLQFVSIKWASAVLARRSPLPVDSFLIPEHQKSCSKSTTSPGRIQNTASPKRTRFLPLWCSRGRPDYEDITQKQALLRSLPLHLCQRSTLTQNIFPSPNRDVCEKLEKIAKKRILEQAGGSASAADIRARAYHLASSALKCVPFQLKTSQDVDSLHSFGPRILAAVREYLDTGDVREASALATDSRLRTLVEYQEFYGVGSTLALELYDVTGIKSVQELRAKVSLHPEYFPETLVKHLRHFQDLKLLNIKQAMVFKKFVVGHVNEPGKNNLHLRFSLCGGFRRGELSGHDVDLVYCRQKGVQENCDSVLDEVVKRLSERGILVSVLSLSTNTVGRHERRYHSSTVRGVYPYAHDILHGLAVFEGHVFRLDIVGVRDAREFPFATLAWSGSTLFQRDIRQFCEKKGWIFNHHGIFERSTGHRVNLCPAPRSEIDVFAAMGLTYRPPFERSC